MENTSLLNAPVEDDFSEDQLPGIRDLWRSVMSRLRIVAVVVLLGIIAGAYMASAPKRYMALATLRIQPAHASALQVNPDQVFSGSGGTDEKINSELAIMQSRTILLKVARELHLADDPAFWGTKNAPQFNLEEPRGRDIVVARMRGILTFTHRPKAEIVDVTCTTASPLLSAKITNSITNEYIAYIFQVRYGSTERVSKWLVGQLDDLKSQVEHDQAQLVDLQGKLGVLGLDQRTSAYLLADSLQGITKASGEATVSRIVAEARLRVLQDSDPNLIENEQTLLTGQTAPQAGLLQTLRSSQAEAEAEYANLAAKYGSKYPDVRQAKAKLDALTSQVKLEQNRIINQAKTSYSAAATNEKMTSEALNIRKNDAFKSHDEMVRYVILQRQYEADRALYEGLMQRLRIAGINAGLESAQVDIVDIADVPSIPRKPKPYQWFLICFLGSFFPGAFLAIVVDHLDSRLGRPEDAEKQLRIPLLAVLPLFPANKSASSFEPLTEVGSSYAEGMQLLRSSILMSQAEHSPKVILITSALPGEGKSTASRNLAAMLAMHGCRVLLIDADLHRPSQNSSLSLAPARGLSELLSSTSVKMSELVVPVSAVEGLFFLQAGQRPPQPATLLSSSRMRNLVLEAQQEYDFVVIDSPPALRVSDPVLCASLADAAILVVRQSTANLSEVRQAIMLLNRGRAPVIGFVMNGVTMQGAGYGSYYGKYGSYGDATQSGAKA